MVWPDSLHWDVEMYQMWKTRRFDNFQWKAEGKMIPSQMKYRGKLWYLHSYVYGKKSAMAIARLIRNTCKSCATGGTYGGKKITHIINVKPETGEQGVRYAVYWRYKE
jgi:hypothetical protein